jgi:hypothetical protein
MGPLWVRPSELPDDAWAVRCGLNALETLRKRVEECYAAKGYYGLSVFSLADASLEQIIQAAQLRKRAQVLQRTTVGAIRLALGCSVEQTEPNGHCSVRFATNPTDEELQRFARLFVMLDR